MKPVVLIILDGWGLREERAHNAIALAKTPNMNHWFQQYPHTQIAASGPAVGLPEGIMGNSEVGHMNIGAGRIVYTGLSQIYQAMAVGTFFTNPQLLSAIHAAKIKNKKLHLIGLLSDGAVHSHQDHLYALVKMAKREGLSDVCIHCFMDGRDTSPQGGLKYIQDLENFLTEQGIGVIASVSGRYYAMDRDQRWDRIERAYDVLTGVTLRGQESAEEIVRRAYGAGLGDEFIIPQNILDVDGDPVGSIVAGDSIIFFNFRADRARQMTRALTQKYFAGFKRKRIPLISSYVCMAPYDETLDLPVAFKPNYPKKVLGEILSTHGLKQLRLAETEKFAHVTYFFNGGVERVFAGEERILIPSAREVATYDLKPEMSALPITEAAVSAIASGQYDVIIINFANSDMVGHTAIESAIIKSVEVVDKCLGEVVDKVLEAGGCVVLTSDHGNAEQTVDNAGRPHTAHTMNPVPFMIMAPQGQSLSLREGGRLCDIAPTLLKLLGLAPPSEMTGQSLISPLP